MADEFTKDATYDRVYKEIDRRSQSQEKAMQFNLAAVGGLFTWMLSRPDVAALHPAYYLLIALINFSLALKWLSEDEVIAGLVTYLREIGAPLETWQRGKFSTLFSIQVRLGDLCWRLVTFFLPGLMGFCLGLTSIYLKPQYSQPIMIGALIVAAVMLWLVVRGFYYLYFPWSEIGTGAQSDRVISSPT
jgi:hypothetical protein